MPCLPFCSRLQFGSHGFLAPSFCLDAGGEREGREGEGREWEGRDNVMGNKYLLATKTESKSRQTVPCMYI